MQDELLNAAILLRRGSWVDPELFERAAKRMAELEASLVDAEERRDFAVTKAAQFLRTMMELAPWLSASITDQSCHEYVAVCEKVFAHDKEARACIAAAESAK